MKSTVPVKAEKKAESKWEGDECEFTISLVPANEGGCRTIIPFLFRTDDDRTVLHGERYPESDRSVEMCGMES